MLFMSYPQRTSHKLVQTRMMRMVYVMNNRADEIKKRIAKRKRERPTSNLPERKSSSFLMSDDEKYGFERPASYEGGGSDESNHPLFRKEVFMFKILASICLVLIVGILFKEQNPKLDNARQFVTQTMETDFQFAAISSWYEEQFGSPLALLPVSDDKTTTEVNNPVEYAVPAGKILESFDVNGQGIMVETGSETTVEAMNEGVVTFAGNKDSLGKTVIIQHRDGSETWYGNLQSIATPLYEYVMTGDEVGKVSDSEDKQKGMFYFAIKQGETFIDPIQVIKFE
jgi:stage IV sporulation protein FA